jgi:DAK2 domain fusion protein YloV
VVDAGGQGVVALLEGAVRYAHGEAPDAPSEAVQPATTRAPGGAVSQLADFLALHEDDEVGYCTNLLILPRPQETLAYPLIRERMLALGESGVVIGDEELVKIHIHTEHPGLVLEEAVRWGELSQIRIDNMAAQVRAVSSGVQASAGSAPAAPVASAPEEAPSAGPEVVAVVSGEGLVAVLRGLGATRIVSGGQTMNPSTEELLRAVEAAPGADVILLPNNGNVILTAEQVTDLTTKRVAIVPSRSAPQGIAALTAFNFDAPLDENLAAMTEALTATHSAEVTRAVRAATIDGLSVEDGQIIGLIDGKLAVAGDDMQIVLLDLLRRMDAASAELVTIYRGADAGEDSARAMVESLAAHYPAATFELVDGGQPHYDYLMSVE